VVDQRREKLDRIERDFSLPVAMSDVGSFLDSPWADDLTWVVPAIPVHFAFQWLLHELEKRGRAERLPVPESVDAQIPNPYRAPGGSLCASFATFICPDTCSEPDDFCTATKGPRRGNLFEDLGRISVPGFDVIVTRSRQLAPGVGGYPVSSLQSALQQISEKQEGCCLIITSCRCHGVIDALRWECSQRV